MWSHYIIVGVWIHLIQLRSIYTLSPLWDSVRTNVHQEYDVREGNQVWVVRMNMGEYKSTDLVVGEDIRPDSRLILTCTADHGPAEWVYSGDGKPEFSTNMTIENLSSDGQVLPITDMNGAKRYVATLTLGKRGLSTKDTGRYNCMTASPETGLKYKTLSAYYHLYVPGDKLFIRQGGEIVNYDLSRSAARIPCGVTNPKTSVTLQKLEKGNLLFVPSETMFYHPISGYYPKQDIPGTYVCTAAYNNTFQLIHFKLMPSSPTTEASYHQNVKVTRKKPTKGPARPEDLEWLMHSIPSKYETETATRKPQWVATTSKPKKQNTKSPYIPFHIRYSSTTYGPFLTFYDVHSSTTVRPYHKLKNTVPTKHKPFNPSEYPFEEIITEKVTKRPSSSKRPTRPIASSTEPEDFEQKIYHTIQQSIPQDLISYRPVFNYFKDTSRPTSVHSQKPTSSISTHGSSSTLDISSSATTTSPTQQSRTTPRRYQPNTFPTTEMPVLIPDVVICSQSSCGTNAECYVHNVYYESLDETKREAGCRCSPKTYIGNPYLECYPPTAEMDHDSLFFNSSFRSPLQNLEIQLDLENSTENHGTTSFPVNIIDM